MEIQFEPTLSKCDTAPSEPGEAKLLKRQVFELANLDARCWLAWAAFDWVVITAAVVAAIRLNNWFCYLLAVWIVGTRQHALGVLGHEGVHRLISRDRKLNDWLSALLCFWPLMTSMESWKQFHLEHHRHTGTEDDPEIIGKLAISPRFDKPTSRERIFFYFILDMFGIGVFNHARFRKATPYLNLKQPADQKGMRLFLCLALMLIAVTGSWIVLAIWMGGLLTSALAGVRLRLWFEHVGASHTHRVHMPWWMRIFIPHNIWYHFEHHKFPAIPFYNLPQVRELDQSEPVITFEDVLSIIEAH